MTEYNITLELPRQKPSLDDVDELMDTFGEFHANIGTSRLGWTEVTITVPAESLRQALTIALALAGDVVSVEGMTSAEFDKRPVSVDRMPGVLSVTEAAQRLGVSRQAIQQRIDAHTLPGFQVGKTWAVMESAVQQLENA